MKKLFLIALTYGLSFPSFCFGESQQAIDKVYKQQQDFVISLLKQCKERQTQRAARESLETLSGFLKQFPSALECVIDTFQICLDHNCKDIPAHVTKCIENFKATSANKDFMDYPDTHMVQPKLNALIICYFNFQLTPLGAVDHYGQSFLQRTNLDTYLSLVQPIITFIGVYALLSYSINYLNNTFEINYKHDKNPLLQETSSTTFKAIAASLFVPEIRPSLERTQKYIKETVSKNYAQLIHKNRKSGYPAKPAKESFNTIKGYADTKLLLTPYIDFCTHLTEYRSADLRIARGILLEGDLADGRKMAQAFAGEITQKYQSLGSSAQCLVYEIHGSSLVDKKLDKVIEECLEFAPCILIINNIDWVYKQKDVEPEVYAHIINKLNRYLAQDSNCPVTIFATSQDHTVLDPVLLEFNKFEVIPLA